MTKAASEFCKVSKAVKAETLPCIGFLDESATILRKTEISLLFHKFSTFQSFIGPQVAQTRNMSSSLYVDLSIVTWLE